MKLSDGLLNMKAIILEELSSPGCQSCKVFEEFWHSAENQFPNVQYHNISVVSPEGIKMANKYMILASPGIVINGELFSTGGVNQKKLIRKIKELSE